MVSIMKPARKRKLFLIVLMSTILSIVIALVLYALRQNINLFYTPSQIALGEAPNNCSIRIGGMVVPGSIARDQQDLTVRFKITDYSHTVEVEYKGILPDLFREGQGIVAQGRVINPLHVKASQVLAKHDEKYMPPEVKDALAKALKSRESSIQ
jgi:cytochrome c-type biogenesis protein CcmE